MCINKTNKPATCCCGCSLVCGVITIGVLRTLSFIGAFLTLEPLIMIWPTIDLIPIIALLIWKNSRMVRLINFIWAAIWLVISCVGIICLFFLVRPFTDVICSDSSNDNDDCEDAASVAIYIVLGFAAVVLLPVQFLFMRILKAYADELKIVDVEQQKFAPIDPANSESNRI